VSYYRGDYYRGDFWSGLGKGIKRIGRDIGRAAKAVAPIAGIILPAVGAATLVGRGVTAAARVKKAGREARAVLQTVAPNPQQTPIAIVSQLTGQTVGMPVATGMTRAPLAIPGGKFGYMDRATEAQWRTDGEVRDAEGRPLIRKKRVTRRRRPQRRLRRTTRARTTTRRRRRRTNRSR